MTKEEIALQLTLKLLDKEIPTDDSKLFVRNSRQAEKYYLEPTKIAEAYNQIYQTIQIESQDQ